MDVCTYDDKRLIKGGLNLWKIKDMIFIKVEERFMPSNELFEEGRPNPWRKK